ncbi:sodium:solute symporter family protein [Salicibibacter cibarius]|uniref:Sodium:solute symporter family protein n=1 Tax=Salicibibacter cibarius TaxID=2743000 RepID=A0A7T6Z7R9_9BACI|nr:sodium:solute symporter family protein [Salicibibacter cibarius]
MGSSYLTVIVLVVFLTILFLISIKASRSNKATTDDFYLANRGLGTIVLVMTTGASFFSTWTLLGAVGNFYRDGVWFMGFPAWAVVHAIFIWIFGARIWYLGKKYGFITPGDLMEKFYGTPKARVLITAIGIIGLLPVMLIQVTGGAQALNSLTLGDIPYWVGVLIMGVFVGFIVTLSGGRGAAWGDTFMGLFFGFTLIGLALTFIYQSGGVTAFNNIVDVTPEVLTNHGNFFGMLELALGLGLSFWLMPHMWQKFYSASTPTSLAKMSMVTPFWNSWVMAICAMFIGILAHTPDLVPNLTQENSDNIIPLFFSDAPPIFGSIIVAAIVAAAISTINSQLLSSASLIVTDIYVRFVNPEMSEKKKTWIGRGTVIGLTGLIVIVAFFPFAQGFLVPISELGYSISIQVLPAVLGPLVWRKAKASAAVWSMVAGMATLALVNILDTPIILGGGTAGLIVATIVFVGGSLLSKKTTTAIQHEFHDGLKEALYGKEN